MHLSSLFIRTLISFIPLSFALPQKFLTVLINKEVKIKYNAFLFRKSLVLYDTPDIFRNFVFMMSMCSDHFELLSIITSKYLQLFVFLITLLPIFTLRLKD